jgi:acyl carrier protein
MSSRRALAETTVRNFIRGTKKADELELDQLLFADGIGLDSLETAELSAVLEDAFGADPFSVGDMPRSVGELLDFYGPREPVADGAL